MEHRKVREIRKEKMCPVFSAISREITDCAGDRCGVWLEENRAFNIPAQCTLVGINRNLLDIRLTMSSIKEMVERIWRAYLDEIRD